MNVIDIDGLYLLEVLRVRLCNDFDFNRTTDQLWWHLINDAGGKWEIARCMLDSVVDDKWSLRSFALAHGAKERVKA